jgi:uncharacterized damage-inducible protein DinB
MITPAYCQMMARYNAWQNHSLYMAANGLSEAERAIGSRRLLGLDPRHAGHLLWGDTLWIARFDGGPGPDFRRRPARRPMIGPR